MSIPILNILIKKRTNNITFIQQVNNFIKSVLGSGFTNHSFRQSIISEFGAKSVNIKIISKFIGLSDVKITIKYTTPTDEDIMNHLIINLF